MGILNVTPDSFSDGGLFFSPDAAVERAYQLCEQGADLIDIGGESTRPGSQRVCPAEQIRRILPVFKALGRRIGAVMSVDTTRAEVAEAALDEGASLVNDVSAGREDDRMLPLVARRGAAVVLMHMKGQPATMQIKPEYQDVVEEVSSFLEQRACAAQAAGIPRWRILLDPGIGFGKTVEHNLELLRRLKRLTDLGYPLVVGPSRKTFIGTITGQSEPQRRVFGTAGAVAWSAANGAAVVRVHDVDAMVQVLQVVQAIQRGAGSGRLAGGPGPACRPVQEAQDRRA